MAEFGPPPPLTHDALIDVLRRNFEDFWIEGLLADPSSLSVFEGKIAAILRLQTAIDENFGRGTFILTAPGAATAQSVVRLSRPSGALGVIPTTSRFLDNRGATWTPVVDFEVAASGAPQVVDVPIQTERTGYYLNTLSPLEYQILDDLFDATLAVDPGPDPAEEGKTAFLDLLGREHSVLRAPGEGDADYRNRIRFIIDQVSPMAIVGTVVEILGQWAAYELIVDLIVLHGLAAVREPFVDSAQLSLRGLQGTDTPFCDDPRTFCDDAHGHTMRDLSDVVAWFDVLLPATADPDEARRFYDDDDPDFGAFFDDPEFGFMDIPPGDGLIAPIAALADTLFNRRAAGVLFRIILGGVQRMTRAPALDDLVQAGDWVDQEGAATDGALVGAVEEFDGDASYATSVVGAGAAAAVAAGDLVFSLDAIPAPVSVSHVTLRARVRKSDVAAGTDPGFTFLIHPSTAAAPVRVVASNGLPATIDHDEWREYLAILEENPDTGTAWALADIAGRVGVGVANTAAGATEELRVSELRLEIFASYD